MLLHNSYDAVVHINNPLLYTGTPVLHGLGNHFLYVAPAEAFNLKIKPFKIKLLARREGTLGFLLH